MSTRSSNKWTLVSVLKNSQTTLFSAVVLLFSAILLTFVWLLLSWGVYKAVHLLLFVIFYKDLLCSLESGDSKAFSNTPRPLQGMLSSLLGRHLGWTQQGISLKMLTTDTSALSIYCGGKERQKDLWGRQIIKNPTPRIIILNYLCWCKCRRRLADFLESQHQNDSDVWDEKCFLIHRDALFLPLLQCCVQQRHPRFSLQSSARKCFIFILSLLCS